MQRIHMHENFELVIPGAGGIMIIRFVKIAPVPRDADQVLAHSPLSAAAEVRIIQFRTNDPIQEVIEEVNIGTDNGLTFGGYFVNGVPVGPPRVIEESPDA